MISLRKNSGNSPDGDTPRASGAATRQRGTWEWGGLALPIAAALILVGMLVAVAFLVPKKVSLNSQASDRGCYLAAAEDTMDAVVNVNVDNLDEQMQRLQAGATSSFLQQVDSIQEQYESLIQESQAKGEGHIVASAVQEIDDNAATVLVVATHTPKNDNLQASFEDSYRASLVVEKVDGVCKTADVEWKI